MSTVIPTTGVSVLSQGYITQQLKVEHSGPIVLIATSDSRLQKSLMEAIQHCDASIEFASGLAAVRDTFAQGTGRNIAACLCGFALTDGTCREVVKFVKHQTPEVPVITVSTPGGSNEYDEYLSSMNAGAFDFLCYPYDAKEVQRILRLAVKASGAISLQF